MVRLHTARLVLVSLGALLAGGCEVKNQPAVGQASTGEEMLPDGPRAVEAPTSETDSDSGAGVTPGVVEEPPRDLESDELEAPAALRARIAELEQQLAEERRLRILRETEWGQFLSALSELPLQRVPEAPGFLTDSVIERVSESPLGPEVGDEAEAQAQRKERRRKLMRDLNALLVSEQVLSMDVLEVGNIEDGWCGPVVVRLLDERGRPVGLLAAERLRLEVSRAGYGVTLLFEEGFERHAGVKMPFGPPEAGTGSDPERTGLRRIHLPDLNPEPWIEALPELVHLADLSASQDDGRWNLRALRQRIDELLREGMSPSGWRMVDLGGVLGDELRDVQLLERDEKGLELRRFFADSMKLHEGEAGGVRIELRGGTQHRLGRRAPFLGDAYRIYLPNADPHQWRSAGVPGLDP